MTKAPAVQIKEGIVEHLRSFAGSDDGYSIDIPDTQIRGVLDVSGTPKDIYGITVSAEDLGDHAGNTGRILVDIKPTITVFTHIEEDADGSLCDALASDVLSIMQSMSYSLDGWMVAWNGNWAVTDTVMDNAFRQMVLSTTIPIQRYR